MRGYLPDAKIEVEKLAKQFAKRFGVTYYDTLRQFDEALCDLNDEVPIPIRSDSVEDEEAYKKHSHNLEDNKMEKTISYSMMLGAIAYEDAGSEHGWVELVKQAIREIEVANDYRLEAYQELGDKLWKEVELSDVTVSSEVSR